jgi:hypothetical protein
LAVAAVILIVTMTKWVKVFPGLLAYAVFGGLLTIVSGHALNHPAVKVSTLEGVSLTVFFAASAVVSSTFTKRKLHLLDRVALFVFVSCIFWQAIDNRAASLALAIAFCCLVLAWAVDHIRRRRGLNHKPASKGVEGLS